MSDAAVRQPQHFSLDEFHERLLADSDMRALAPAAHPPRAPHRFPHVRRRGSLEQGRALETLGHAVEYW